MYIVDNLLSRRVFTRRPLMSSPFVFYTRPVRPIRFVQGEKKIPTASFNSNKKKKKKFSFILCKTSFSFIPIHEMKSECEKNNLFFFFRYFTNAFLYGLIFFRSSRRDTRFVDDVFDFGFPKIIRCGTI